MVEVERGTWRINSPSFQRLIVIRIKVVVYSFWTVNMEVELPPHHLQSLILSSRVYRDGSECVTLVNNKARHFLLIACVLSVQLLIKYPTGWEKKSIIPTISWLCKGFFLMCIHWKKTKTLCAFPCSPLRACRPSVAVHIQRKQHGSKHRRWVYYLVFTVWPGSFPLKYF